MNKTKIKICGLRTLEDARLMNEYKVDYAGIILFYEKSKRCCSIERAHMIIKALNPVVKKVAVTVSPSLEQAKLIETLGFDILQVHGELKEEVLKETRIPILKAFNEEMDKSLMRQYMKLERVVGFVFDGMIPGSGKVFDWTSLEELDLEGLDIESRLLVLAGGLNADNVLEAIETVHPDIVDVSSSVEDNSGTRKDKEKIEEFVRKVRAYE